MTKLIPAEGLLETLADLTYETEGDLLFDGPLGQERRRKSCLVEIRKFQRNALQEAAKVMCSMCSAENTVSHRDGNDQVEHGLGIDHWWCRATPIHNLMRAVENPAPAGQPPEEIIEIDEDGVVRSLGRFPAPAGQDENQSY